MQRRRASFNEWWVTSEPAKMRNEHNPENMQEELALFVHHRAI